MHGGARGSGAPAGNRNALKEGLFTRFAIEERQQANALWREAHSLLKTLNASNPQRRRDR
jgi:glucans biosynthesis protein